MHHKSKPAYHNICTWFICYNQTAEIELSYTSTPNIFYLQFGHLVRWEDSKSFYFHMSFIYFSLKECCVLVSVSVLKCTEWIGVGNILIIIGNSHSRFYATRSNSDWLVISQSTLLTADWLTLDNNEKVRLPIEMFHCCGYIPRLYWTTG